MARKIPRLDKSMAGVLDAGVVVLSDGRIAQQFLKE